MNEIPQDNAGPGNNRAEPFDFAKFDERRFDGAKPRSVKSLADFIDKTARRAKPQNLVAGLLAAMPIVIDHLKDSDLTCPRFYCDVCGKPVESADDGIVAWDSEPGQRVVPAILHTDCDGPRARRIKLNSWMDLNHFLVHLLHNLKMDEPNKLAEARRQVEVLSRLAF